MDAQEIQRGPAGFSLIELMMVVVIITVLASMAVPRYIKTVEKGRTAEARNVLGQIRAGEVAYFLEYDAYTTNLSALQITVPSACNASFYFRYNISGNATAFTATANRCTASGRNPNSLTAYALNITEAGNLGGTAGYL